MALKLKREYKNTNVFVEYWKVAQDSVTIRSSKTYEPITPPVDNNGMGVGVGIDPVVETPLIQIMIYGYLNEEARREDKAPMMSELVSVPCPTTGNFEDERRPLLYYSIKQLEGWEEAADC